MTVYVLTEGEYSDYGVVGVTLDYNKALNWLENQLGNNWQCPSILEFDTDDKPNPRNGAGKSYYATVGDGWADAFEWAIENIPNKVVYDGRHYKVYVYAKDQDHAKKIAQDLVAEYRAREEGIT